MNSQLIKKIEIRHRILTQRTLIPRDRMIDVGWLFVSSLLISSPFFLPSKLSMMVKNPGGVSPYIAMLGVIAVFFRC